VRADQHHGDAVGVDPTGLTLDQLSRSKRGDELAGFELPIGVVNPMRCRETRLPPRYALLVTAA